MSAPVRFTFESFLRSPHSGGKGFWRQNHGPSCRWLLRNTVSSLIYLEMRKVESLQTLTFLPAVGCGRSDKCRRQAGDSVSSWEIQGFSRTLRRVDLVCFFNLFKVQFNHKLLHLCPINNQGSVCTKGSSDCGQTADTCVFKSVEVHLRSCTSGFFPNESRNRKSGSGRLIMNYTGWREQYSVFSRKSFHGADLDFHPPKSRFQIHLLM